MLDTLVDGTFANGDTEMFRDLHDSLLYRDNPDQYFILADFESYSKAQDEAMNRYKDRKAWGISALKNTAMSGKFSSDRTIQDYVDDIWHLDKLV